ERGIDVHEGTVVLPQEEHRLQSKFQDRLLEGVDGPARNAAKRGVQNGRVLPFKQPDRRNFVANADERRSAHPARKDVSRLVLLLAVHGREDGRERDGLYVALELHGDASEFAFDKRTDHAAVELIPPFNDEGFVAYGLPEVFWPVEEWRDGPRRRRP